MRFERMASNGSPSIDSTVRTHFIVYFILLIALLTLSSCILDGCSVRGRNVSSQTLLGEGAMKLTWTFTYSVSMAYVTRGRRGRSGVQVPGTDDVPFTVAGALDLFNFILIQMCVFIPHRGILILISFAQKYTNDAWPIKLLVSIHAFGIRQITDELSL